MSWPNTATRMLGTHAEVMQHTYDVARESHLESSWYSHTSEMLTCLAYRKSDEHDTIYVAPQQALPGEDVGPDSAAFIERVLSAPGGTSTSTRFTRGALLDLQSAAEELSAASAAGGQSPNASDAVISALEQSLSDLRLSEGEDESHGAADHDMPESISVGLAQRRGRENTEVKNAEVRDIEEEDEVIVIIDGDRKLHCRVPDFVVYVLVKPKDNTNHEPVQKMLFLVEVKPFPSVPVAGEREAVERVMKDMRRQAVEQAWHAFHVDKDMPTVQHLSLCGHWYLVREFVRERFQGGGYELALRSRDYSGLEQGDRGPSEMYAPGAMTDYHTHYKTAWTAALSNVREHVEALWREGRL